MNNGITVDREPFADIIRRLVRETRDEDGKPIALSNTIEDAGSYMASVAEQIAASGLMTREAAARRIYSILNAEHETVSFWTADKILQALGLTHLWRTELEGCINDPKGLEQAA